MCHWNKKIALIYDAIVVFLCNFDWGYTYGGVNYVIKSLISLLS